MFSPHSYDFLLQLSSPYFSLSQSYLHRFISSCFKPQEWKIHSSFLTCILWCVFRLELNWLPLLSIVSHHTFFASFFLPHHHAPSYRIANGDKIMTFKSWISRARSSVLWSAASFRSKFWRSGSSSGRHTKIISFNYRLCPRYVIHFEQNLPPLKANTNRFWLQLDAVSADFWGGSSVTAERLEALSQDQCEAYLHIGQSISTSVKPFKGNNALDDRRSTQSVPKRNPSI